MMTKADCEALAEAVSGVPNMSTRSRLVAAARVADACAKTNPVFSEMMTKADYEALAEAISGVPNMSTRSRLVAAARVADACARMNPRFSKERFLKACRLDDDELATYNMANGNNALL